MNAVDEKPIIDVQPQLQSTGRAVVGRPLAISTAAVTGQHHNHLHHHHEMESQQQQQHQLLHNRTSIMTDYGSDPVTASSLSPPSSGGIISISGGGTNVRRPFFNGNVPDALCGVSVGVGSSTIGHHPPHIAVWHPRPLYPFPLALPNTTNFWHHSQPPFPPPNATFSPFIEVSSLLLRHILILVHLY